MGISFVVIIVSAWLIHKVTNQSTDLRPSPLNYWIFYIISVWTTQGSDFVHPSLIRKYQSFSKGIPLHNPAPAFRLMCAFSFLGIYLLSNYYTGAYTSLLSIPLYQRTIRSIDDLAFDPNVITQTVKGSSTEEYVMVGRKLYLKYHLMSKLLT